MQIFGISTRHLARRFTALSAAGFLGLGIPKASPKPSERYGVATLAWMTGCWVEDLGPLQVEDEWTAPTGDRMVGVSRTHQGDSTIAVELRTIQDSARSVMLTSITNHARMTLRSDRFTSSVAEFVASVRSRRVVVRYDRDGSNRLVMHSEHPIGIRQSTLDEIFHRVPCGR